MNKNHFKNRKKVGDYVLFCDTCGMKMWASEATVLPPETGLGGCVVCPNDVDKIDYGLIPYVIEPEANIPLARDNMTDTSNTYAGLSQSQLQNFDPMGTSPNQYAILNKTWDKLTSITWENLTFISWENLK